MCGKHSRFFCNCGCTIVWLIVFFPLLNIFKELLNCFSEGTFIITDNRSKEHQTWEVTNCSHFVDTEEFLLSCRLATCLQILLYVITLRSWCEATLWRNLTKTCTLQRVCIFLLWWRRNSDSNPLTERGRRARECVSDWSCLFVFVHVAHCSFAPMSFGMKYFVS